MTGAMIALAASMPVTKPPAPAAPPSPPPSPPPPPADTAVVSLSSFSFKGITTVFASASSFNPATVAGASIVAFSWASGSGSYSATGTLGISVAGNLAGSTRSAVVQGVNIGSSGAGSYDASTNETGFSWPSGIHNPFGTTNGATIACIIS